MNTTRPSDDLTDTLRDIFALPKSERKSAVIKRNLFTRLLVQPVTDRNFFLADIANTQGIDLETAKIEFLDFKAIIDKERKDAPFKPLPDVKPSKVFQRPAQDPNAYSPEMIDPLETETVESLLAREIAPVRFIVKPILAEGLAIFAGPSKIGKSLACLSLSIAVASGSRFLDEYLCEPGRVLYLGLEDGDARLKARFKSILKEAGKPNLAMLDKALKMRKSTEGGIEQVELWLTEHPDARLVIVDTLARIRRTPGRNSNSYLEDSNFMAPLQSLAQAHHVCIMLIHHTRKMAAADPLDLISGTTGLVGVADQAWILKRGSRGKAEAILEVIGRDIESIDIGISLDENLKWTYKGEAGDLQKSGERQAIVNLLSENPGAIFKSSDIAKALQKSQAAIGYLLNKLMQDGIVLSGGYSKYYIPKERI